MTPPRHGVRRRASARVRRRRSFAALVVLAGAAAASVVLTLPGAASPARASARAAAGGQAWQLPFEGAAARAVDLGPPQLVFTGGLVSPPTSTTERHNVTTTVPPTTAVTTTVLAATTTTVRPATTTTGCAGALPAQLATTGGGSQLVTVEASGYGTTYATLTAWARSGSCWQAVYGPFTARLGWSGLTPAASKQEGDGATPEGLYGFGPVMYGNVQLAGAHYPYHQLVCGDWWDEDPQSADYNLFVHWTCGSTPPFAQGAAGAGSEALWQETGAYPSFAVIAYNTARVPGKGSAIFLHYGLASPTAGCVSIGQSELDEVLDWLAPGDSPAIVIGTAADITSY